MRVLFYTGKGGVGKSTVSAATAWQLSRRHRVLIVSLDPAHNLGDVFGVTLNHHRKAYSPSLDLQEADLSRLTRQYLEQELGTLADTYRYMQTLNLDRYFDVLKYSPGLEEYALLSAVEQTLREARGYDYVVFDTPPTGLTLRLLALPRITLTWLERLGSVRRLILEKRYTIQKIQSRGGEAPQGIRLAYSEDEDRVMGRLKTLQRRYEALQALLQGPECGVVLVFNPDSLSLRETERLIRGLDDLELNVRLLVDNKLTDASAALAAGVESRLQALVPGAALARVRLAEHLAGRSEGELFTLAEDLTAHV